MPSPRRAVTSADPPARPRRRGRGPGRAPPRRPAVAVDPSTLRTAAAAHLPRWPPAAAWAAAGDPEPGLRLLGAGVPALREPDRRRRPVGADRPVDRRAGHRSPGPAAAAAARHPPARRPSPHRADSAALGCHGLRPGRAVAVPGRPARHAARPARRTSAPAPRCRPGAGPSGSSSRWRFQLEREPTGRTGRRGVLGPSRSTTCSSAPLLAPGSGRTADRTPLAEVVVIPLPRRADHRTQVWLSAGRRYRPAVRTRRGSGARGARQAAIGYTMLSWNRPVSDQPQICSPLGGADGDHFDNVAVAADELIRAGARQPRCAGR